jgi:hypothetical protein
MGKLSVFLFSLKILKWKTHQSGKTTTILSIHVMYDCVYRIKINGNHKTMIGKRIAFVWKLSNWGSFLMQRLKIKTWIKSLKLKSIRPILTRGQSYKTFKALILAPSSVKLMGKQMNSRKTKTVNKTTWQKTKRSQKMDQKWQSL